MRWCDGCWRSMEQLPSLCCHDKTSLRWFAVSHKYADVGFPFASISCDGQRYIHIRTIALSQYSRALLAVQYDIYDCQKVRYVPLDNSFRRLWRYTVRVRRMEPTLHRHEKTCWRQTAVFLVPTDDPRTSHQRCHRELSRGGSFVTWTRLCDKLQYLQYLKL